MYHTKPLKISSPLTMPMPQPNPAGVPTPAGTGLRRERTSILYAAAVAAVLWLLSVHVGSEPVAHRPVGQRELSAFVTDLDSDSAPTRENGHHVIRQEVSR